MITNYFKETEKIPERIAELDKWRELLKTLRPSALATSICSQLEPEGQLQNSDCEMCEHHEACDAYIELGSFLADPGIVCFCNGLDGKSDPKTGHRAGCFLGEAGRKERRKAEDRIRKHPLLSKWISRNF